MAPFQGLKIPAGKADNSFSVLSFLLIVTFSLNLSVPPSLNLSVPPSLNLSQPPVVQSYNPLSLQ